MDSTANEDLSAYASKLAQEFYLKVFCDWKEIAFIMRDKEFGEDEEDLIDVFDLQCKEWGFLLKELFGLKLGTGDYAHMMIEHASMLMRSHRSIGKMSNQGFEASHKVHRQLYLRATSHDSPGDATSLDQLITHQSTEMLLFLRLSFRKAKECIKRGSPFHFNGCHWSLSKKVPWRSEDIHWIHEMDDLLNSIFSGDFLNYIYEKSETASGKVKNGACIVDPADIPTFRYNHMEWEGNYVNQHPTCPVSPATPASSTGSECPTSAASPATPASSTSSASPTSAASPATPASSTSSASPTSPVSPTCPASPATPASSTSSECPTSSASPATPASPTSSASPASPISPSPTSSASPASTTLLDDQVRSSCPDSPGFDNLEINFVIPEKEVVQREDTIYRDLTQCTNPGSTRGQLASVKLPPVQFVHERDLRLVQESRCTQDAFKLSYRPSESVVDKALALLRPESGSLIDENASSASAIQLGALGIFTLKALEVCKAFCYTAKIKNKVDGELAWLTEDDEEIKDVLLTLRPSEEFLKVRNRLMDAADFSNFACERYLDGYSIDISCMKFLEKNMPACGIMIYLPSHATIWADSGCDFLLSKLKPFLPQRSDVLLKILGPVHVAGAHWGLLCIDVIQGIIYYDDGMHMSPPDNLPVVVRNVLDAMRSAYPSCSHLDANRWGGIKMASRFGMPLQPTTGEGSSSCGVGVIFALRDIVRHEKPGIPQFNWSYGNSSSLRKQIMLELITCRKNVK